MPYKLVIILERDFLRALTMYENLAGEVNQALTALESELSVELLDNVNEEEKQPHMPKRLKKTLRSHVLWRPSSATQ